MSSIKRHLQWCTEWNGNTGDGILIVIQCKEIIYCLQATIPKLFLLQLNNKNGGV